MSDGWSNSWLISACVLVAVCSATTATTAQTTYEYRATVRELEDARDSVRRVFYELIDSIPYRQVDTVRVGTLTVLTEQLHVDLVRQGTVAAWDLLKSELKSDTGILSYGAVYLPYSGRPIVPAAGDVVVGVSLDENSDADKITDAIVWAADRLVMNALDERIEEWLPSSLLYDWTGERRDRSLAEHLEWTYVALVTSPYSKDRGCFKGSIEDCRRALWIDEVDNPVTELYDAQERRRIVQNISWSRAIVYGMQALRHGCTIIGHDSDCIEYLDAVPRDMLSLPYTPGTRRSLALTAMELGGDGAYGRLAESDTLTVAGMLESVSGLTVDSLVARWYRAVIDARPTPTTITPTLVLSSMTWVFVFVLIATRSTRWRI